jgi:hypothetical protein
LQPDTEIKTVQYIEKPLGLSDDFNACLNPA